MATDRKRLAELAKMGVPFAFRVLLAKKWDEKEFLLNRWMDRDKGYEFAVAPGCMDPQCDCGYHSKPWTWTIPFTQRVRRRRDKTIKEKQYVLTIVTEYSKVISCEKKRVG